MFIHFIYNISNSALFTLMISFSIAISMICLYFIKRFIPLDIRNEYNDGIGFIAATTGVLYAILIGLLAVSVVGNYDKAQDDANVEADSVAAIYRLANDLPDSARQNIQDLTKGYLNKVINKEWPYMREGKSIPNVDIINKLNLLMAHYKSQNLNESLAVDKLNQHIDMLYNSHQLRNKWSVTSVHPYVMGVLLLGTFLVILIHLFLGIEERLHIICILILDIVISSILFLVVAVDRPYMGYMSIEPIVYQTLLDRLH